MREKFIRTAALLLALLMAAALLPMPTAYAADEDLSAIVEEQIRAYADSIDQENASDGAAGALASHGISGGGRKLSVGANHALTATLMNSELLQAALAAGITCAVESMQGLDWAALLMKGGACWRESSLNYNLGVYEGESVDWEDRIFPLSTAVYSGTPNTYDDSLEWIAGDTGCRVFLERSKVTATQVTYTVSVLVDDRFDFSTANTSGFKKLLSGLGALLFREFDWEAKASFEITVPYQCSHSSGSYHWTYDAESHTFHADTSEVLIANNAKQISFEDSAGEVSYYHTLNTPVRLFHDKPWELEFTTTKPWYYYTLSPVNTTSTKLPSLGGRGHYALYLQTHVCVNITEAEKENVGVDSVAQFVEHRYGTQLSPKFDFPANRTYTFRLKNVITPDGSNMIWLTVRDNKLDEDVLHVPMDDYYKVESWNNAVELQDESSDWVSGKDIYINYFGNKDLRFLLDCFDLKIWENGEGGESCDYFETTIVAPTCTEGYTLHTCAACGYSYKTDFVPANPHTYSSKVTPPTCTGEGYTTYTCTACSHSYKADPVPAVGHEYTTEVTPPTCTEKGYTTYTCTVCGETHTDDEVNALNHSYSAGYCARCGSDTVTASIADGCVNVRATRGIKTGTWVLAAGYAADGRMVGFRIHPWEGSPQTLQTIDLPAGETFILYFIKGSTWMPLRTPVIPQ